MELIQYKKYSLTNSNVIVIQITKCEHILIQLDLDPLCPHTTTVRIFYALFPLGVVFNMPNKSLVK